jgi:2,3-bisphosphoglycerate-independent phosphoglycerate mutase
VADGFELTRELSLATPSKIVLLVLDGLGRLPHPITGATELESANTPNLDKLASQGSCGLTAPVGYGITAGSAPGHLALFGYDPVRFAIGRGILESLGIDFELFPSDIAARGNFCTLDENGFITDRRAGRISTDESAKLCKLIDDIQVDGVKFIVRPVKEHRFILVLRGINLSAALSDTDPQALNVVPKEVQPLSPSAQRTADVVSEFVVQARDRLKSKCPANMFLLRGFSAQPDLPSMADIYKLRCAAIASYPMYRGLAKVVGMDILQTGTTLADELGTLEANFLKYDFFFLHVKGCDAAGEDGDFARKVAVIEEVDRTLPRLLALQPDVLVIAGDHSTPATLKSHSWHEVPCLIASRFCRPDNLPKFGESYCSHGSLGHLYATSLMPLMMAHALKYTKFGA